MNEKENSKKELWTILGLLALVVVLILCVKLIFAGLEGHAAIADRFNLFYYAKSFQFLHGGFVHISAFGNSRFFLHIRNQL